MSFLFGVGVSLFEKGRNNMFGVTSCGENAKMEMKDLERVVLWLLGLEDDES